MVSIFHKNQFNKPIAISSLVNSILPKARPNNKRIRATKQNFGQAFIHDGNNKDQNFQFLSCFLTLFFQKPKNLSQLHNFKDPQNLIFCFFHKIFLQSQEVFSINHIITLFQCIFGAIRLNKVLSRFFSTNFHKSLNFFYQSTI